MKRNIIINGALGLLLAGSMASCASDYLDTEPLSNVTDAQVGATTENLAKAINGMGFFLNIRLWFFCLIIFVGLLQTSLHISSGSGSQDLELQSASSHICGFYCVIQCLLRNY